MGPIKDLFPKKYLEWHTWKNNKHVWGVDRYPNAILLRTCCRHIPLFCVCYIFFTILYFNFSGLRKICHLVVSNLGGLKNLEGIVDALKPPPPVKRTQKGPDTTTSVHGWGWANRSGRRSLKVQGGCIPMCRVFPQ